MLYITVDLLSANALWAIADSGEAGQSKLYTSPRRNKRATGLFVAAAYVNLFCSLFFCPFEPLFGFEVVKENY